MSLSIRGIGRWGVVLGLSAGLVGVAAALAADGPGGRALLVAQKSSNAKKKPAPAKKGAAAKKGDDGEEMGMPDASAKSAAKGAAPDAPPAEGALSFKRDIAPILVANCAGCHTGTGPGVARGKLDMTTFDKLMAGGKRGKDIAPGDPDSSRLVQMIKGEETPKMPPPNGQRGISDEAVAKIEAWVKAGARLDAGVAATDPMSKYAASTADLRKAELDKLTPEQRDKLAETAGRDRWKKATKVEPEVTTDPKGHFLLLSNLPKPRADKLLKAMEAQYGAADRLLSSRAAPALPQSEKIGLYVFKDNNAFVEFVRANENQEVEQGEQARGRLNVESPYLVAVDPANGGEEAALTAAARKGARKSKKGDDSASGPERTLAGVLTEQLVAAAANQAGKPPRWISLGLGAFVASTLEPGSPYYRRLRATTLESAQIGWVPKASEALGGQGKLESTRAIGFSLFEWMAANAPKAALTNFVRTMLDGQDKLDDAIGFCLELDRQTFFNLSEQWITERYGRN